MNPNIIFQIFNTLVLLPWLLMLFAPNWKYTKLLVSSFAVPAALSVAYVAIIFTNLGVIAQADFGTLKGIQALFVGAGNSPYFAAAAWFHYLAFDLFVGTWIFNDSQKANINHFAIVPCLVMTFMLGPTGFLVYLLIKLSPLKPKG